MSPGGTTAAGVAAVASPAGGGGVIDGVGDVRPDAPAEEQVDDFGVAGESGLDAERLSRRVLQEVDGMQRLVAQRFSM